MDFLFSGNFKTSMLNPEPPETFKNICCVQSLQILGYSVSKCHDLQPGSEKPVPIFQNSAPKSDKSRRHGHHEEGLRRERGARLRDHQQVDPNQGMVEFIIKNLDKDYYRSLKS